MQIPHAAVLRAHLISLPFTKRQQRHPRSSSWATVCHHQPLPPPWAALDSSGGVEVGGIRVPATAGPLGGGGGGRGSSRNLVARIGWTDARDCHWLADRRPAAAAAAAGAGAAGTWWRGSAGLTRTCGTTSGGGSSSSSSRSSRHLVARIGGTDARDCHTRSAAHIYPA